MLATAALALTLATAGPNVDNPYFPLPDGRHWTYREGKVRDVVTVTDRTKLMANGVTARVVHDASTLRGVPVEITDDYYAQDSQGNVWYLGESTTSYEHGRPESTEARSRPASTARRRGSSCPPTRRSACATGRSSTRATPRTARRSCPCASV